MKFLFPFFTAELTEIITAAKENGIDFVYAISPGLDMAFSAKEDIDALKRKVKQVCKLSCIKNSVKLCRSSIENNTKVHMCTWKNAHM